MSENEIGSYLRPKAVDVERDICRPQQLSNVTSRPMLGGIAGPSASPNPPTVLDRLYSLENQQQALTNESMQRINQLEKLVAELFARLG